MAWLGGGAGFDRRDGRHPGPRRRRAAASCWSKASRRDFPVDRRPPRRARGVGGRRRGLRGLREEDYAGWTITGTAFGKGPAHGTQPGQQPVSGFVGHGLVNTFLDGDAPQGTATSKKFRIQRPYVGFLIGGGSHRHETCVNLLVDGKVVRTATGKDREALEPASWDVSDFQGKEAVIEIVDRSSGGWGHINMDQIIFSDLPPEPSCGKALRCGRRPRPCDWFSASRAKPA